MPAGRSCLVTERRMSWLIACCFAAGMPLAAQTDSSGTKPYATLDRQSVTYRGPVSAADKQLPDDIAVIGMILPLRGAQEAEGKALLAAAQIALEEEQERGGLPDGRKLVLAVRDESGPWGQASSEILKLIEQDHALAVITSANGATAHQAEQIANKISFPILTLASDSATTQTNVPWVFRLGPSDMDQARAMCQEISEQSGVRKILLIVDKDHDGRVGGEEFEKAARERKLAAPQKIELEPSSPQLESVSARIQAGVPDDVVVWADASVTKRLLPLIGQWAPSARVYLCSKAAQLGSVGGDGKMDGGQGGEYFTVAAASNGTAEVVREKFAEEYRKRTGKAPGMAAFEAYEAVHLIAAGIRTKGASRIGLREYLAETDKTRSAPGVIAFDPAGNSTQEFSVVRVNSGLAEITAQ